MSQYPGDEGRLTVEFSDQWREGKRTVGYKFWHWGVHR